MKRTTQMISLLLCIVMVLGLLPMQAFAADIVASGYCGGEGDGTNLTWTLDGDGLLTISGTGAMADYNNYWGQNLAPWGNYRTTIKGLILGEGITHIGNNAFHVLENLSGTLELPSSVVSIGTNAFRACALTGSLTIPNNTETIGGWAFCGCSHLDGTLTLGKNLTKVYDNAFEDTNFTKIDIGSCTSDALIGKLIPALLDTLNEISVDPANPNYLLQDGILYNRAITEIVFCSRSRTGTLEIPNGVEIISDYAFFRCADLTGELKFPDTLTRIGDTAFCKCTGFTGDLRFPDTVSYIGHSAFSECTGFDGQLFLPKGVTLGERVFNYCQGLRGSIVIPEGVSVVPASAFFECSGFDRNIILGSDVKKIDAFAFKCCKNVTGSLDIPAGVTHIGVCAFEYCNALNGSAFLPANFHVASWAFKCGIKNFYFRGNAPTGDGLRHYTFPDDATLYYLENTSGWTDSDAYDAKAGTWYGYKLEVWDEGGGDENEDGVALTQSCELISDTNGYTYRILATVTNRSKEDISNVRITIGTDLLKLASGEEKVVDFPIVHPGLSESCSWTVHAVYPNRDILSKYFVECFYQNGQDISIGTFGDITIDGTVLLKAKKNEFVETYDVKNDTWKFKNPEVKIEEEYWRVFFPKWSKEKIKKLSNASGGGLCSGMVLSTINMHQLQPVKDDSNEYISLQCPENFGKKTVGAIEKKDICRMTQLAALSYIKIMQTAQYNPSMQKELK